MRAVDILLPSQSIIRKGIFSVFISVILFCILEGVVRTWHSDPSPVIDVGMQMKPHSSRIWSLEEGDSQQFGVDIQIDATGLRATNIDERQYRWLTIGDSSIFGHGLSDEDTLHFHLEQGLLERQMSVDVFCGGVPGYSTLQSLRLLNEVGWALKPDLLIIGSLWSDNNFDHFIDQEWLDVLGSNSTALHLWLSHSALYRWLSLSLNPFSLQRGDPNSKVSWLREPYKTGHRRVPVQLYGQMLDRMIREASERNISVVLLQPANRYRLEGMDSEATWDVYFETQRSVALHRNVPIIDAAEVLRLFGLRPDQAFIDELHPSGEANKWLARALIDLVLQEGWPDKILSGNINVPNWNEYPEDRWATGAPDTNIGQDLPKDAR